MAVGTIFRLGAAAPIVAAVVALSGCQTEAVTNSISPPPFVTPVTLQNDQLRTLPPPTKRVIVAVYDFPDLTGQFKERENVQSLSRAVTQGGASMLIKALQDAGERRWFTVLDRAQLDDLLKERQIVTEMRRVYLNEAQINAAALPPLRHAGIILEGGIIGYDANTLTGGLGARYLGIGGDTKYQQDTATVTLRAVSTSTGEVLATVTIHKVVASVALQGGVFRYVMLDRILEAEAGVTQNEPKGIAIQQAIEKAVQTLIIEGADIGIWNFADPVQGRGIIDAYLGEKYGAKITPAAATPPPPDTVNPTYVVETMPVGPRPRSMRAAPPVAANVPPPETNAPPPPAKNETVGALPPPPAADEVVGSAAPARQDADVKVAMR